MTFCDFEGRLQITLRGVGYSQGIYLLKIGPRVQGLQYIVSKGVPIPDSPLPPGLKYRCRGKLLPEVFSFTLTGRAKGKNQMTSSIQVCGRSKAVSFNLSKFDYSQDSAKALAAFSTLVATRKAEVYKAFNELCHICYAKANTGKTQKERHADIRASRDEFFAQLPKKYASAYARAITALEWGIDEMFDEFDFSDFLESEKKESQPKKRGAEAVIEGLRKKLDSLQNKKNRNELEEEERLIYAFLVKASKEFSLK